MIRLRLYNNINNIKNKKEEDIVATKVWKKSSTLGVWGEEEDVVYVMKIKRMEQSDHCIMGQKDVLHKVEYWICCLTLWGRG